MKLTFDFTKIVVNNSVKLIYFINHFRCGTFEGLVLGDLDYKDLTKDIHKLFENLPLIMFSTIKPISPLQVLVNLPKECLESTF